MKLMQFTVTFELDMADDDAPITFETAVRMAIRHRDLKSAEWLNFRIRRMWLTTSKTITEEGNHVEGSKS